MSQTLIRPIEPLIVVHPVDEPLYEIVGGERSEKPPLGNFQAVLGSFIHGELHTFARARGLGRAMSETLFKLNPTGKLMRCPDVAFYSYERWPRDRKVNSDNGLDIVPELAVEVNSPSNLATEVLRKVRDYFRSGVVQVWVVFPEIRQVYVYTSANKVAILGLEDSLEGGELLPGFRMTLAELFEDGADEVE